MFLLEDLERVINSIADPIFVKDRQHNWVLLNRSYCKFMGFRREQLIGKSDYDFFPKEQADVFWAKDELVFEEGVENTNEEEFTDVSGLKHFISTRKCLFNSSTGEKFIVGCIRDLTDLTQAQHQLQEARDRLELMVQERTAELATTNEALRQQITENERTADQLRQSQKMEAVGRLAGGIAHDFNNLLNIIIGYASLLQEYPDADAKVRSCTEHITTAAERAASLTRQLLAFSRKQVLKPEVLNMHDILLNMGKMLPPLLGEDIQLTVHQHAECPYVKGDRGQIEQVIMNLAVNARDAMPRGGKIVIKTANAEVQENVNGNLSAPLPYLSLSVTDTGTGIDPEVQSHMFEPFFTTKEQGRGTGLGLATVYAIVSHSGGHIKVSSKVGRGTTIRIDLPCSTETGLAAESTEAVATKFSTSGTILLVEDEPSLRLLLGQVLRSHGYTVVEAENGTAAIDVAIRHTGRIDLLITDIIMPGMRGWVLAQQLAPLRPEMNVLYISGHADPKSIGEESPVTPDKLLPKPFKPDVLLRKVNDILGSRAISGAA